MGLAPYGEPKFKNLILDNLIDLKEDGTFRLNMDFFNYATGVTMTNEKFSKLFGKPVRSSKNDLLTKFHMDIASSIQNVTEEIVLRLVRSISKESESKNLCMAGGVALNCVANGKIYKEKIFENIWIQPAAGDAGGALGAALGLWHKELKQERLNPIKDNMKGSYLGPSFSNEEVHDKLTMLKATFEKFSEEELLKITANELSKGKTIGWFQGKMEFGPRALGARSIIADPRSETMQKKLNLKIKYRESFRPFAPSILREYVSNWFEKDDDVPFMMKVFQVKKEKKNEIPAVTHVDGSGRLQTVNKKTNYRYHQLINEFYKITNVPILLNTSFNENEPVVCNPEEALNCFLRTKMDVLVLENYLIKRI
jgi:carbamoyltransferase